MFYSLQSSQLVSNNDHSQLWGNQWFALHLSERILLWDLFSKAFWFEKYFFFLVIIHIWNFSCFIFLKYISFLFLLFSTQWFSIVSITFLCWNIFIFLLKVRLTLYQEWLQEGSLKVYNSPPRTKIFICRALKPLYIKSFLNFFY